jgi:hypothetical protein
MRTNKTLIAYLIILFANLAVLPTNGHLEQEFIKSTAGVIVALPNNFFDSFTVQLINSLEARMLSDGFNLGSLRKQTVDLRFTKATFLIAENKLSGL